MKKILIIGAGASGLMSAVTAARLGAAVTVLEGMEKPGKKLLTTGNGRCNLTNKDQSRTDRYRGGEIKFVEQILAQFSVEETLHFFENLGLLLHEKEGYVYPYVNQASAVLDSLIMEARRLGVKIKCSEKVIRLESVNGLNGWKVYTQTWCYEADAVIVAAGSKAAPQTGSDGSGYEIARMLGHSVITPREALVPLKAKEKWIRKISGVRMPATVTISLKKNGKEMCRYTEKGELQWTDYGISGIVVFQLSRYAVNALSSGYTVTALLDLLPDFTIEEFRCFLKKRQAFGTVEEFFNGILPKKVIPVVLELAGVKPSEKVSGISEMQLSAIAGVIKELSITINGNKSFETAQVCSGGVNTTEIWHHSLESKINKGLYFAGEVLDVDGICGGYNLQWAWSSGYVAGKCAAQKQA